jgi:hypothetical protein
MSEEEKKEKGAAASAGVAVQKIIETLKTNPTARYVLIGAVVVVLLASFMGGGDGGAPATVIPSISVGQAVTVENPNGGDSMLAVAPGMMAVADPEDTEQNVCLVKGAAKGKVVEGEQVAAGLSYVKVEMLEGECKGRSGWTSKVNVKAG